MPSLTQECNQHVPPRKHHLFKGFMINQVRRTVCSNDAGAYAYGSVSSDRITQAEQVSAEEPDKKGPTRWK